MKSSSRPGPITRFRLGCPPGVASSSMCAALAMIAMLRPLVAASTAATPSAARRSAPDTGPMPPAEAPGPTTCLVTGATGYIGGRLVPELLDAGHRVRVMTRSPERLRDHPWADRVEIVRADAGGRRTAVAAACDGVDVVYYLIHALGSGPRFEATDRHTAAGHGAGGAARPASAGWSTSARSNPRARSCRRTCARGSRSPRSCSASGVPTAVLRAAVVLGSGSASFEMLRYLTERLPVMVTPRWVHSRIQPIAVRDVLRYLVGCATLPAVGAPLLRRRRPRRHELRRDDAAVRRGRRPAPAPDPAGAVLHARRCRATGSA